MKFKTKVSLLLLAAFGLFAVPAFAQVSLRGLYVPTTQTSPQVILWVHDNDTIGVHVFDSSKAKVGFGKTKIHNDTFSVTTTTGQTVSGTLSGLAPGEKPSINGKLVGSTTMTFTAPRTPIFRSESSGLNPIGGRFDGVARDTTVPGQSAVTFIIDANDNVYFVQATQGSGLTGGIGTVTEQNQTVNDTGDDDTTDGPVTVPGGTFSIHSVDGSTITGSFILSDFVMDGTFQETTGSYKYIAKNAAGAYHLANISTRAFVNTGQGQLIAGFIVRGGPKLVLLRAIGPGLTADGVSPVLAAPELQLFHGSTQIATDTGWRNNANVNDIIATLIPPKNDGDSALLLKLEPGSYTAVVSGSDGGTGIALVEGYEVLDF